MYVRLYPFHLSSLGYVFRRVVVRPVSLSRSIITIARPFPPSLLNRHTRVHVDACMYVHISERVTGYPRCSVIRMNHEVAEKAHAEVWDYASLRILHVPYDDVVPGVSECLYNTRACRAQANRHAYPSRENAPRLFRHRPSRSRRLLVAEDGNYSSATSRKIQGHDYLVYRAASRLLD